MNKISFSCTLYNSKAYTGGTIFLVSAFRTKLWHYRSVINALNKRGFRVYVYTYKTESLLTAHPEDLADFSARIVANITDTIAEHRKTDNRCLFGIIGVSAGSMVALHAAKKCPDLEKIMLVTVPGGTAQNVWETPTLKKMKHKFESLNLSPGEVYEKLGYIEATYRLDLLANRKMLIYANEHDPVIRYQNTQLLIQEAQKQKIDLTLRHIEARRHSLTIIKVFKDKASWLPFFLSLKDNTEIISSDEPTKS